MIIPEQYTNIGGIDMSNDVYPNYYKPVPTSKDYSKGYINRYFVQKINDLKITETNKTYANDIHISILNLLLSKCNLNGFIFEIIPFSDPVRKYEHVTVSRTINNISNIINNNYQKKIITIPISKKGYEHYEGIMLYTVQ